MYRAILLLPLVALLGGSTIASVAAASDRSAEASFVQANCATCHATGQFDHTSPRDGAVPFAELAANPAVSALALRVMLQTSHQSMPNLRLTPDQMSMVVTYVLGLRRGAALPSRGLTQINDQAGPDRQDHKNP